MEYRTLPNSDIQVSILGLGANGVGDNPNEEEIQKVYDTAIDQGINFFDLAGSTSRPFVPLGRAIAGKRKEVAIQLHFGADYETGTYGWTMDIDKIKKSVEWQLKALDTDYVDFGFVHCLDKISDLDRAMKGGILTLIKDYKEKGIVRHIALSSHTPAVVNHALDLKLADLVMFSINPAYDYSYGSYGIGQVNERMDLYKRCEKEGVAISVMKPYAGGILFDASRSPFGRALTPYQCIQYVLDKPGVVTVVPGIGTVKQLEEYLGFLKASDEEKDYSVISGMAPKQAEGMCVYCNHCAPCPAGLDIGLINKYYDLSLVGDELAKSHYHKLDVKAGSCIGCGHCENRCPFQVKQMSRMKEIQGYFGE